MTLLTITRKLINPLGIKVRYAKDDECENNTWCAWSDDDIICIPKDKKEYYDKRFMKDFKKRFPKVKADEITISILHEVGHCMVKPNELCANKNPKNYFDRFDERVATAWAAEYITTHKKKIKKFEKKLKKVLEKG